MYIFFNTISKFAYPNLFSYAKLFALTILCLSLVGCGHLVWQPEGGSTSLDFRPAQLKFKLPASEYEPFTVNEGKRKMHPVLIKWVTVDDPAKYCGQLYGLSSANGPVVACAAWTRDMCTIYTGKTTSHTLLGHETRHCFEGAFH